MQDRARDDLYAYGDATLLAKLFGHLEGPHFDSIGEVDGSLHTTKPSDNAGYKNRLNYFANSSWRHFNIPIHNDICTLRKYLPPNTKLEFEFQRTPDKFSLLSPIAEDQVKIIIEDLKLSVTRYTPAPSINTFYHNFGALRPNGLFLVATQTPDRQQTEGGCPTACLVIPPFSAAQKMCTGCKLWFLSSSPVLLFSLSTFN